MLVIVCPALPKIRVTTSDAIVDTPAWRLHH